MRVDNILLSAPAVLPNSFIPIPPPILCLFQSLRELDMELMGKRRKINPGVSSSAHISPSNGRTSVSWRRGSRHAEREREVEGVCVSVGWGGGSGWNKKESPPHGSRASEPSGPAQGRAPPVDKRSILSISLSALDNKQKFSTPRSCLSFEMRIVVRYTHTHMQRQQEQQQHNYTCTQMAHNHK